MSSSQTPATLARPNTEEASNPDNNPSLPTEPSSSRKAKGKRPANNTTRITDLENQLSESNTKLSSLESIISRLLHLSQTSQEGRSQTILSHQPETIPDHPLPSVERPSPTPGTNPLGRRSKREYQLPDLPRHGSELEQTPFYPSKRSVLSEKILPLDTGDEPTYAQWQISVRDRLEVNTDHYPSERSRKALIWSVTAGQARQFLEPRYLSDTHGFQSAQDMIDLLATYFLTGNETADKRRAFHTLEMDEQESFAEFKASFLSLAIQGKVAESEWFFYCWEKITPSLRRACDSVKILWKDDFATMVQHLTHVDTERRWNLKRKPVQKPTKKQPNLLTTTPVSRTSTKFYPRASLPVSNPNQTARATTPFIRSKTTPPKDIAKSSPTPDTICYNCSKPGHFRNECPNGPSIREIGTLEGDLAEERASEEDSDPEHIREGNEEA